MQGEKEKREVIPLKGLQKERPELAEALLRWERDVAPLMQTKGNVTIPIRDDVAVSGPVADFRKFFARCKETVPKHTREEAADRQSRQQFAFGA